MLLLAAFIAAVCGSSFWFFAFLIVSLVFNLKNWFSHTIAGLLSLVSLSWAAWFLGVILVGPFALILLVPIVALVFPAMAQKILASKTAKQIVKKQTSK